MSEIRQARSAAGSCSPELCDHAATANPSAEPSRVPRLHRSVPTLRWDLVLVALAPVVALALDSTWVDVSPYSIDPWVYLGLASDYQRMVGWWDFTYYWSRFPSLIPMAVSVDVLGTHLGIVASSLAFAGATALAVYGTARRLGGRGAGAVAVAVLLLDRMTLAALGSTYIDRVNGLLVSLGLYAIVRLRQKPTAWWGAVLGAVPVLLLFNHPTYALFGGVLLVAAAADWRTRRLPRAPVLERVRWAATGAAIAVILLLGIHWLLSGSIAVWEPWVRINEAIERGQYGGTDSIGDRFRSFWLAPGQYWVPTLAILTALPVALLWRRHRRDLVPLFVAAGGTWLVFVSFELTGRPSFFGLTLWVSVALPPMAVLWGVLVARTMPRRLAIVSGVVIVAALAVLLAVGANPSAAIARRLHLVQAPEAWMVCVLVAGAAALAIGVLSRGRGVVVASALAVVVLVAGVAVRTSLTLGDRVLRPVYPQGVASSEVFDLTVDVVDAMNRMPLDRPPVVVRDGDDPSWAVGLAATGADLGDYVLLSNRVTSVPCPRARDEVVRQHRSVIVLGAAYTSRDRALAAFEECGIELVSTGGTSLTRGPLEYTVSTLGVEPTQ